MDNCQILWKNTWKTRRISCELAGHKFVGKRLLACSGCSVWWKIVRFCEFVFGFREKCSENSGKDYKIRTVDKPVISTIST